MKLSEHFDLAEMTHSAMAARRGLENTAPPEIVATLRQTAEKMEAVRDLLGKPISVLSGYRSASVNKAVGGAKNSAHLTGHAVDFICPGFGTPLEVAKAIEASGLLYDQVIYEYGEWVHISFAPTARQQELTKLAGRPYELGIHT